ncbi:MAG: apolipoprotein N-acyltransferase [Myxococcales bacterium]|nr:apolipoprotein N-acyltransferase [Myxococcales bacterium]
MALAGIAATSIILATPPHDLWPLALLGTAALYLAVTAARRRTAMATAWLAGFAINLVGNGWALDVMGRFAGAGPGSSWLVLVITAAYQASVFALAGLATSWLQRARVSPLLAAPLTFALAEAVIPFVFPWYLGMAVVPAWPLIQVAELGGPPAVTALIVLIGGVLVEGARALATRQRPARAVQLAAAIAVGVIALGGLRAWHVARTRTAAPTLRVAVIQPNFGLVPIKRREVEGANLLETLREATERAGDQGAELVVWPESAFPFLFDRAQTQIYPSGHPWDLRGRYRGRLLFGALSHPFGEAHVFNSAVLVAGDGAIRGTYDKVRLVVFGEYIPMRDRFPAWAARLRARTPDWPDIQPGLGPRVLTDGDLRIGPLICYEDILPDHVAAMGRAGDPNLLVTVANHAWFGASAAPHQALALATLRAVELRRDLVRASNTGVSSIGDALGRVHRRGRLVDVDPARPPGVDVLIDDVRLVDGFALGPWSVPAFPWACALALVAATARARRRRPR